MNCKNCEHTINDDFKYCPKCGQKIDDRLTIRVLFNNFISNYFSLDARVFRSFFPLIFKPGFLAAKFIEGKRLKYLHPAQFYLFISIIFFFLFSFLAREQQMQADSSLRKEFGNDTVSDSLSTIENDSLSIIKNDSLSTIKNDSVKLNDNYDQLFSRFNKVLQDSLFTLNASEEDMLKAIGLKEGDSKFKRYVFSQVIKLYLQRGEGILKTFHSNLSISIFFLMPLFAFLLKLLFYGKGQFVHHLIFTFYYFTFVFIVFILILIVSLFMNIPVWMLLTILFIVLTHLFLSIKRFYKQSFIRALFKTFLLSFSYSLFVLPLSIAVMGFVALLLY